MLFAKKPALRTNESILIKYLILTGDIKNLNMVFNSKEKLHLECSMGQKSRALSICHLHERMRKYYDSQS
jgi:hypothetical protein